MVGAEWSGEIGKEVKVERANCALSVLYTCIRNSNNCIDEPVKMLDEYVIGRLI